MNGLELAGLQDTFSQRPNDRLHTHQFSDLLALVFTVHQHDLLEGQEYTISFFFSSMTLATTANRLSF